MLHQFYVRASNSQKLMLRFFCRWHNLTLTKEFQFALLPLNHHDKLLNWKKWTFVNVFVFYFSCKEDFFLKRNCNDFFQFWRFVKNLKEVYSFNFLITFLWWFYWLFNNVDDCFQLCQIVKNSFWNSFSILPVFVVSVKLDF